MANQTECRRWMRGFNEAARTAILSMPNRLAASFEEIRSCPRESKGVPAPENEHLPVTEQRCRRSSRRRRPEEVLRRRRHEGARAPGRRRSVEQLRLGDAVAVFRPEAGHDQHATVAEQERRMIHARYLHRIRRGELSRRRVEDLRRRGRRDSRGRLGWWRDVAAAEKHPPVREQRRAMEGARLLERAGQRKRAGGGIEDFRGIAEELRVFGAAEEAARDEHAAVG